MKKYIIYFACLLAIMWGCSSAQGKEEHVEHNHSEEAHNHAEGKECDHDHNEQSEKKEGDHGDEIIFSPEQAASVGLEVVTVSPGKFHQVIKTSGQILSAQGDEVTISATSSGIVSFNKSSLNEGTAVRGGESLLSISSKNMIDGDPIIRAKSAYAIAQREYQRAESLIGDKLISEKEYNEIKLNYENAKNAYQAIGQRSSSRGVSISTPIGGFIKTKLVSEGQYVDVGQALMTVTQNKRLQLRADVSERYYKDLVTISSANFKTSYDKAIHNLSELNGRIVSYGRATNSQEFYLPAIFEFDNIGQVIAGSYVEVYLLGQPRENVITIPVASLTEEQGIYFVYLQIHPDAYKKQEVAIGSNDGGLVEILSGLTEGDKVVSKGAYYVKLASTASAIPHAHEH
ncbi:efflux RND transporter periplasmic adaptor subunit [Dysgonomonas sp. Marseille-P4677]|uniref:efflux RND transporter periplasmic adaptor subunit n=1 Tax=Dysgonomonas sp. Marseille-P4677 TaxID=2364790 RepID=UPI0019143EFB|nr:efflux RND transporter periplasmic adaptor subunit [Dysgonomonas sp. Marseille-P4677]MBK5721216.1 efflux RND transporter periplasmic adaptor subunit [Dysgonomonas sp. Marseille-P4677]